MVVENNDDYGLGWIDDEWSVARTYSLRPFAVCVNLGVPGPGVLRVMVVVGWRHDETSPTIGRLLGNGRVEQDQTTFVPVQGGSTRRSKQSKLVDEVERGMFVTQKNVLYAGPLENLQLRWK